MENPWLFLPIGYLFSILVETPVLLVGLSARHSTGRRLFAGVWLTACTYPIVIIVIPQWFDPVEDRFRYLLVAETFAPVAECLLFLLAFWAPVEADSKGTAAVPAEAGPQEPGAKSVVGGGTTAIRESQTGIKEPVGGQGLTVASDGGEGNGTRTSGISAKAAFWRDMITITVANLASFGLGELVYALGWGEWLNRLMS